MRESVRDFPQGIRTLFSDCIDLVFPPSCLCCGGGLAAEGDSLCPECLGESVFMEEPLCPGCGRLPAEGPLAFCSYCHGLFHRDGLYTAATYSGTVKELVLNFKYRADFSAGRFLGEIVAAGVKEHFDGKADVVIPVPLHCRRQRSRGFNQSLLLSRPAARLLGVPLEQAALKRNRATRSLAGLEREEREKEMAGTVSCPEPSAVSGKRVLLVDDVFTSGATTEECCRVLKKAGARNAVVAVAARTP